MTVAEIASLVMMLVLTVTCVVLALAVHSRSKRRSAAGRSTAHGADPRRPRGVR